MKFIHTIFSDEKKLLLKLLKEHKSKGTEAQKMTQNSLKKGIIKELKKKTQKV